jgi:hypothetical protein
LEALTTRTGRPGTIRSSPRFSSSWRRSKFFQYFHTQLLQGIVLLFWNI